MDILFNGVREFSSNDFEKNRELFSRISREQNPHTLFIGCSDSRVVPDLITKSMPGDLFVVRNIANVVPRCRASSDYLATTSAIEYAILVLNVDNIVICGHSNCGGCKSLFLDEAELEKIPHTRKWLELAKEAKTRTEAKVGTGHHPDEIEWLVEQENVVGQMNNLLSYPFIAQRYAEGKLKIFGWYYDIGSGGVYNYNTETRAFEKIE